MHIFPSLIGKLRHNANDDKEVLRDWKFPFIHHTVNNDSGCLDASVRMVYCAAFNCNANGSKNRVTYSWSKFPTVATLLKSKLQADEAQLALLTIRTREDCIPGLSWC